MNDPYRVNALIDRTLSKSHYIRKHRCDLPGVWKRFFDRVEPGDKWVCCCGLTYELDNRYPNNWFSRWRIFSSSGD